MAAMIASKRIPASKLIEKLLLSPAARSTTAAAPAARRAFNTSVQMRDFDNERSPDADHRSDDAPALRRHGRGGDFPSLFSDAFDPFFGPTRSLSQVLNMMDQMLDNPFAVAARGPGPRRGWEAKEEKEALHLRIDMPGLGKEHVSVSVEQNTLIIKGEGERKSSEEESVRRYSSRIDLPPELYRLDQIQAEMKNGVLTVVVPKVKEEERKDVFQVQIQ